MQLQKEKGGDTLSLLDLSNITAENVHTLCDEPMTDNFFVLSRNEQELAENFSLIMGKAREFGVSDAVFQHYQEQAVYWKIPELWEKPKAFEKKIDLMPFPLSCLPTPASEYLKEISANIQVSPDMAVLPLLSVLSLCVQGKAVIKNPGGGNIESLNIYTLTVAEPGERKSGVFKALTAPIYRFQKEENRRREPLIREYQLKKSMLTKQLESVSKGKNTNMQRANELSEELSKLTPVYPLTLNVTDTTPEALAAELVKNGEKIGILNDEGGIFDILSGLYSSGTANIDLFLKAYDGSPYNVIRRTQQAITLENPLITFGLMAQAESFKKAMNNPQFSGRGLVHRFMYAFPESKTGQRAFLSKQVSDKVKNNYNNLIYKLLSIKPPVEIPVILCDKEAFHIFQDYHNLIEDKLKDGGEFEYMREWGNKQVGRALKIAGIFHLCEHEPNEPLSGQTALNAVNAAMWTENQALKAFGEIGTGEEEKSAKYVLNRIKKSNSLELSKKEILRLCRKLNAEQIAKPLELLEDTGYIRVMTKEHKTQGRPCEKYKINPLIY